MLSDRTILARLRDGMLRIDDPATGLPAWSAARVQASSYDMTLGAEFLTWRTDVRAEIDPREDVATLMERREVPAGGYALLEPGEFALATTHERIMLDRCTVAYVSGKSSVGRLGLFVENAGLVDAGFNGQITLELVNAAPLPIRLYPGMPVAQLSFATLSTAADLPYAGKYAGQSGPTPSRFHRNWDQVRGWGVAA